VYERLCMLVCQDIKELKMDLNYRTIVVEWEYDVAAEEFVNIYFGGERELTYQAPKY